MIFNTDIPEWKDAESYKERNLYYKLFAGYLFNEMISEPSLKTRSNYFFNALFDIVNSEKTLLRCRGNKEEIQQIINTLSEELTSVTFDYHPVQVYKDSDKGEMSDVLIWGKEHLISIECKFLSNMKFGKDYTQVQERIKLVSKGTKKIPLQVLLMTQKNWNGSYRSQKSTGSFVSNFSTKTLDNNQIPCVIILWEEIAEKIADSTIRNYLYKQLSRE